MDVLMFGGTRFFGLRLARRLLRDGHRLTVLTRGRVRDDLGDAPERIRADRSDAAALAAALEGRRFDLVYDQICYTPREAKAALDALGDRVGRYVFTSTMAVYTPQDAPLEEEAFAPDAYPYDLDAAQFTYAEGKRQAEAYFFRHARCPVVAARVSMVVSGTDDYTGRFDFHVSRIARGEEIGVDAEEHEISFVTAWDAADFLHFLSETPFVGPINCASEDTHSVHSICAEIGSTLDATPRFAVVAPDDASRSPYAMGATLRTSAARAREIGFEFPALTPQLPEMTREASRRLQLR